MKKLILLLIIIASPLAYSDAIYLGVYTTHYYNNDEWNNKNNLIAVEHNNYIGATFINSYGFRTYLAAKDRPLNDYVSVIYGVSYGYDLRCFAFIPGKCLEESYTEMLAPALALKLSARHGPISTTAIIADYVNLSIGIHF